MFHISHPLDVLYVLFGFIFIDALITFATVFVTDLCVGFGLSVAVVLILSHYVVLFCVLHPVLWGCVVTYQDLYVVNFVSSVPCVL